jgi:hypothetical protein
MVDRGATGLRAIKVATATKAIMDTMTKTNLHGLRFTSAPDVILCPRAGRLATPPWSRKRPIGINRLLSTAHADAKPHQKSEKSNC